MCVDVDDELVYIWCRSISIYRISNLSAVLSVFDSLSAFDFFLFWSTLKHSQKRSVSSAPNDTTVEPSGLIESERMRAV